MSQQHRHRRPSRPRQRPCSAVDGGIVDVTTTSDLEQVADAAARAGRYALDTEFHREHTYWPQLALIQLHWTDDTGPHNVLIDPLCADAAALAPLLTSGSTALLHAAEQDLEILQQVTGALPTRIFDTQVAAGFAGFSTPSLSTLTAGLLNVDIDKSDRLTDWLARPLTDSQRHYAIGDVIHLPAIAEKIARQLERRGRLAWAEAACEDLRTRPRSGVDPADAWKRLKDARLLRGEQLGIAAAVAEWRERRAMELDRPPRRILSDLAVVGIAQKNPDTVDELAAVRQIGNGADRRNADAILAAVKDGRTRTVTRTAAAPRGRGNTGATVTLVNAWIGEIARREQIDQTMIATRDDVERLVASGESAKLGSGWRSHLLGDSVERIATGAAALAVQPDGSLTLVDTGN